MEKEFMLETAHCLRSQNDCYLFDFGKDAFAQAEIEFTGLVPGYVIVSLGECLRDDWLDSRPGGFRSYVTMTIERREGHQKLAVTIPSHIAPAPQLPKAQSLAQGEVLPFRYMQIYAPYIKDITCRRKAFYGGFDDTASGFSSDNKELNRLWEFCKYSIKATNAFEYYVDGNRERLPYEADAYINQLGHFCTDCAYDKARRTIDRLLVHQTWPVEWSLLMPVLARDYVIYSGDTSQLKCWQTILQERLFNDFADVDGLLPEKLPKYINQAQVTTIIDWPECERDNTVFGPQMAVPNCYRYAGLCAYAMLYNDSFSLQMASKLKSVIRKKFFRNGIFADAAQCDHGSIHSQMFAITSGVADAVDYPELRKELCKRGMACSVYGAQFLLDALYFIDCPDYALKLMTATGERSWLKMMEDGSTITMEAWNNVIKPNQDWNHPWGAAPANVIPRRLCGVRPLEPGFRKILIQPMPAGVRCFELKHPTPRGPILVRYNAEKPTLVQTPDGQELAFKGKEKIITLK